VLTTGGNRPGGTDVPLPGHHGGVGEVREQVRDSQLRRTFAQLGAFCRMCCRFVHGHHGIEDARRYPDLVTADPSLQPVIDELSADHVRIGGLLRTLDDEQLVPALDRLRLLI
jgi:hypothetical protein